MTLSYSTLKRRRIARLGKRRGINSTLPVAGKTMKRSKGALRKVARGARVAGIRKVNPKRKASEFKRCYGSPARVEFVKSLPCAACGIVGFSQNAHMPSKSGVSRKGDLTNIAPLCGPHFSRNVATVVVPGCHALLDELWGKRDVEAHYGVDLDALAAETEAKWQAHIKGSTE